MLFLLLLFSPTSCLVKETNGMFTTERTENVSLGGPLTLTCTWLGGQGGCQLLPPSGTSQASGDLPEASSDTPRPDSVSCSRHVSRLRPGHLGDWRCQFSDKWRGVRLELVIPVTISPLEDIRLPASLEPLHYNVLLRPDMESQIEKSRYRSEFTVSVRMEVRAVEDSQRLTFHADQLTPLMVPEIRRIRSHSHGHTHEQVQPAEMEVEKLVFDFRRTFVHVDLKWQTLFAGSEYQISLVFAADGTEEQAKKGEGFQPRECSGVKCWFTMFMTTFARNAFPCLDEPAMKATFSISVVRKKEYKAMSNMPLLTTVPDLKHGYVVDTFDTTLRMSTYLVAVTVVYDYMSVSAGDNVTVWAPSEEMEAGTDMLAQPYIYIGHGGGEGQRREASRRSG